MNRSPLLHDARWDRALTGAATRGAAILLALALALGTLLTPLQPATVASAATQRTITLKPAKSAFVVIAKKRTSTIAEVAMTVPQSAVAFGLQFRAKSKKSGYRAELSVRTDGTVLAKVKRIKSSKAKAIGSSLVLPLNAQPGDRVHLEATVAAKKKVGIYLRAWLEGKAKPTNWQLAAFDSSKKRIRVAGRTYLWARTPSGSQTLKLSYTKESARAFSAARAAKIGVQKPTDTATSTTGGSSADDTFSFAVIPDTQKETHDRNNVLFLNRTNWLVNNKSRLDLRYVLHTGDMTNWGWLDQPQLARAKAAIDVLKNAGIPYNLAIGNHDTAAVGWDGIKGSTKYGGSAYQSNPECAVKLGKANCKSTLLVRNTDAFNDTFPLSSIRDVGGRFEAGKIDNNWTSFTANGTQWLVLTLELWPRPEALAWAEQVVAAHPDHNVLIQTHHYLDGNGTISSSAGGYGATSPRQLYDQIVSKYPNVKMVFSGHVGTVANRTDAPSGNKVLSFLMNDLGSTLNPVRTVTVNTRSGEVTTAIQNPIAGSVVSTTSDKITIQR